MAHLKKIKLKNGLRLLLVKEPQSRTATVLILVAAGSEYETKRTNGLSHFLEHLAFKGTRRRPQPGMIAEELAALGARSNAFTSGEYTGYWAKAEAHKLPHILDIVSDLYLEPVFDPAEIEKERGVIIQEINMDEDDLPAKAQKAFSRLVYGDQPAGWDVAGEKKVIRTLKRDEFMKYRRERYVPAGTVIAIAGNFNEQNVIKEVRKAFGGIPHGKKAAKRKTVERQSVPRIVTEIKGADQAHLVLGFRAFTLFDKRRHAFQVLADVLGGGMSSRLFKKVREELGAAYYVGADADLAADHGLLNIAAGVDHGRLVLVLRAILEECRRIREELVPEKELRKAKDHILGSLVLGLETSDQLAGFYGGQEILAGETLSPEQVTDRIKVVTAEEVRRVARDVLRNAGMNLAVVGPRANEKLLKRTLTL